MVKRRVKKICYFEAYCQHVTTNLSSLVHVLYTIGEDFLNNGSIVKYTHTRFSFLTDIVCQNRKIFEFFDHLAGSLITWCTEKHLLRAVNLFYRSSLPPKIKSPPFCTRIPYSGSPFCLVEHEITFSIYFSANHVMYTILCLSIYLYNAL